MINYIIYGVCLVMIFCYFIAYFIWSVLFFTFNLSVSLVMSSLVSVKFGVISVSGFMLCWLLFM